VVVIVLIEDIFMQSSKGNREVKNAKSHRLRGYEIKVDYTVKE